jgi:hypothetical protein
MNESNQQDSGTDGARQPPTTAEPRRMAESFYDRALWRMQWTIAAVGLGLIVICAWRWGLSGALGAALGAAISWRNLRSLSQVVNALGERITTGQSRERGALVIVRFVSRILLMAVAAYVIFRCSLNGVYGFLAGLCVTVPALFCEAAYELFAGLRHEP